MSYEPTNWQRGDRIASALLNHMENGIAGLDGDVAALQTAQAQTGTELARLDGKDAELEQAIGSVSGAISELEAGSLSAVGASAGQTPVADGSGGWAWSGDPDVATVAETMEYLGIDQTGE